MKIKELLEKLQISSTQQNKLVKRYQKMGVEVANMEISEEDAKRILRDFSESINLNEYVAKAVADMEVNVIRAASDIRSRLSSEGYPVMKFSETTFSVTPNTYYIDRKYLQAMDDVVEEYKKSIIHKEPFQVRVKQAKEVVLKSQSPEEQKKEVQKRTLIGIIDYLRRHPGWERYVRKVRHKEKAFFYMEEHDWFGLDCIPAEEIIFENTKNNPFYILIEDIPLWDEYMKRFFDEYGLNGDQLLTKIINRSERKDTMMRFEKFLKEAGKDLRKSNEKTTPPHVADVAWVLSESEKELKNLSTSEVGELLEKVSTGEGQKIFAMFTNWVREREDVPYQEIFPVEKEPTPVKGYSIEEYIALCHLIFYYAHIAMTGMIQKALDDIRYAGMWMYHSVLAIMNLRGTDIETIVKFPDLKSDINWIKEVPRDADGLEKAIVEDLIPEETYIMVGKWFVDRFTNSEVVVNKTNLGEVVGRITPELLAHFGRLFLIGEVHHMRGSEKFLDVLRWGSSTYCNRMHMASFYGEEIYKILGRRNFQRVKINHTVSQMEKKAALDLGMDGLTAITIAAYSRGHSNIATMFHYVGDHSLTGETAEVVLWLMMERQVLGVVPYLMLLTYFPDTFGKLSPEEQTEMIELSGLSALDIEVLMSRKHLAVQFEEALLLGDVEDPVEILKGLMAIGQGYGASMDKGGYCLKRALGRKCDKKTRDECILSGCKCEVLTAEAVPTLVRLILEHTERAKSGDVKAYALLKSSLYPNFTKVRSYLKKTLPENIFDFIDGNMKSTLGVA